MQEHSTYRSTFHADGSLVASKDRREGGLEAVLSALAPSARRSGSGWSAHCPAHDDRHSSLSVNVGDDGKVLLQCHAGCTTADVVDALGVEMKDLFPNKDSTVIVPSGGKAKRSRIVTAYDYQDEAGTLLFQSVRHEPKTFRQRRRAPNGEGWTYNLDGVRMVPYRLPELIRAAGNRETIFVAEGEKDVDTLFSWGLAATCNPMGAGKWGKVADLAKEVLRGVPLVVILPDDDDPGRRHGQDVARSLAGVAATVKVLPMPNAKDVSEWREKGGTKDSLLAMIDAAPTWLSVTPDPDDLAPTSDLELAVEEISPLRWIIPDFIPEGLSILVGNPKVGKSAIALNWAYDLSEGYPVMGRIAAERCHVLYCALEDNKRRVRDRIQKIRGGRPSATNLGYITLSSSVPMKRLDQGGKEQISRYLEQHPECRLVLLDTWIKVKPLKSGRKQEYDADSEAWSILHKIASEFRVAIVVLHHTRKPVKFDGDWMHEVSGTSGVTGTADTILLFRRLRGNESATLTVGGREHDGEKQYVLRGDSKSLKWTLSDEKVEDHLMSVAQKEIREVLKRKPYLLPKEIAAALGKENSDGLRQALQRMQQNGNASVDLGGRYYIPSTNVETTDGTDG